MPLPVNSRFIGVTALGARVSRAVDFASRSDVWAVLAKPTAWMGNDPLSNPPNQPVSDLVPPLPNPTATSLTEPVVAVKATSLLLVVPDNTNGTIEAYGFKWRVIDPNDALTEQCRWVLVNASFDYNTAPTRQVDSYLVQDAALGDNILYLKNAGGYQVGDTVIVGGVNGQQTTVTTVRVNDGYKVGSATGTTFVSVGSGTAITGNYNLTVSAGTNVGTYKFTYGAAGVLDNVTWADGVSVSITDAGHGSTLTISMGATAPATVPQTDSIHVTADVNMIVLADALLAAEYAGYYVTNLSYPTAFEYRQVGIMSHVTSPVQAKPGQRTVPATWLTDGYLEWYYNDQPVPRRLNGRDGILVVLTF